MKLAYLGILFLIASVRGHARLIEPPSRASEWRFGFDNPPDYNDNADYCGGIAVSTYLHNCSEFKECTLQKMHIVTVLEHNN